VSKHRGLNMSLAVVLFSILIFGCENRVVGPSTTGEEVSPNAPNSTAVHEVLSGQRTIANAAWWGFNDSNSTAFLQAAINSGAIQVVVPNMGRPWVVDPIYLASNQEVVFQSGTILVARKGSFQGPTDALLNANEKQGIVLQGYGAKVVMRKKDYEVAPYVAAEWRHALSLLSCKNIKVFGLQLVSSGGDGIYIGRSNGLPYCDSLYIKDVVCDSNYRQGISVISARNLLIENCVFRNTGGTPPQGGIDFEPNYPDDVLSNCVIRNSEFRSNAFYGIIISVHNLTDSSEPISITIESSESIGNKEGSLCIWGAINATKNMGTIRFISNLLDANQWLIDPVNLDIEGL
jgi:polygalacturonase